MINHAIQSEPNSTRAPRAIASTACGMLAVFLLGGCALGEYQQPTHRWVSAKNSSSAEYHADNTYCTRESAGKSGQREFVVNSPEYTKYVDCMNARGYALAASSDSTVSSR